MTPVKPETDKTCTSPEKHEQHVCCLHSKGLTKTVEQVTDHPTVTCAICLVNANAPEYVCAPTTLGTGYHYSDMQGSKKIICGSVDSTVKKEKLGQ
ncbi:hypothetical protein [Geomesophilobacter sediminis]|uniref:Uncharacterized protein n=1 Tax=Geomesophilobacter sediminis TaxID=2798584 RepID=A0A8J7M2H9_9BACT|nr:hypothetical protein [Geomesophilobacter sediminis]MBJ6727505.1 hypothetical protein [Geomesophilobacter sediminis]